ncbi:MAG: type I glyceraldehyde-3-phosphate dehydrogenase [Chitinophagales bacterium]|nr:type I glyceraldehyde-3-phosphate dehydrogenase [Chitinophagales bacterium]
MKRIAINGLGRIGRIVFRLLYNHPEIEIVAINDLAENEMLAYLLQYDSAHGKWSEKVTHDDTNIFVNGKSISCTEISNFKDLPWQELGIDIVIECTGKARNKAKAQEHIDAGAKKVIISAPADAETKTFVIGINDDQINSEDTIISNASCTTNCLAPMIKIMNENFGLESVIMSTVHAYTGDQNLHDSNHKSDFRRGRAAAENIVPTSSNASQALERVMPEMKGKIIGGAMRVPVLVGSLTELYCNLSKPSNKEEVNALFKKAAEEGIFKNILEYTDAPLVSSDIISNPHSCIIDGELTTFATDKFCKIVGWYDNEYGYSNRLAELVIKVAKL